PRPHRGVRGAHLAALYDRHHSAKPARTPPIGGFSHRRHGRDVLMPIHRAYFFDSVRFYLDANQSLTQGQVDGLNLLLEYADLVGIEGSAAVDDRMAAYIFATAWHETGFTCQPIAEYGQGAGKPYGVPAGPYGQVYYGRGFVQLTWYDNYATQDAKLELNG